MQTIAAAGNVLVPAYLALREKGYTLNRTLGSGDKDPTLWCATKGANRFLAEDVLSLLGLVAMQEVRGNSWKATDREIDSFFETFPGN
jgi:hypothetical protein